MGISRHVKFRYFIENILQEPYDAEREWILARKFSDIVFHKVMCCDFVPGAKEFLEENYETYDFILQPELLRKKFSRLYRDEGWRTILKRYMEPR